MIPITCVKTMRESDAATIAGGVSGRELMRRAGEGLLHAWEWQGPVCIACGVGNNGGDGYVLALLLQERGIACRLLLIEERFSADGGYYFEKCRAAGIPYECYRPDFSFAPYTEIVDCLLGTGAKGNVTGTLAMLIEAINASQKKVIAVDINSGLDGDSGLGTPCVRSDLTVSIGTRKTGHYLNRAKDVIGRLCNVDIGISVPDEGVSLLTHEDLLGLFPHRAADSHKGNYGYVTVMGGCPSYAGAVKLANMSAAALRAGCGVAQLAVPESIVHSVSPYLLESTLLAIPADGEGYMRYSPAHLDALLARQAAIAVGMGWGRGKDNARILTHLLSHTQIPLVIDADGLNTLAEMDLSILRRTSGAVILTPHLKEFERLSGIPMEEIAKAPVAYARRFAREHGVILLLKGSCTVVTDGEGVLLVDRGCVGMATAGSGDVLSGILAGMLGFLPPTRQTVAAGAYLAGRAGELAMQNCNPVSMVASDTVAHIADAVRELL